MDLIARLVTDEGYTGPAITVDEFDRILESHDAAVRADATARAEKHHAQLAAQRDTEWEYGYRGTYAKMHPSRAGEPCDWISHTNRTPQNWLADMGAVYRRTPAIPAGPWELHHPGNVNASASTEYGMGFVKRIATDNNYTGELLTISEFTHALAAHDEAVRATALSEHRQPETTDTFDSGYQAAIADLRWLASARNRYTDECVQGEVATAQHVADILEGTNDGFGWLPSWLWDEWAKIARHPQRATVTGPVR